MEIKSILIKDTTREERIRIVQEGLNQCGGACDFCNGCDNLGGGSVDAFNLRWSHKLTYFTSPELLRYSSLISRSSFSPLM